MESFRTPLEGAGAVVSEICLEFEVVLYATQFIPLSTMEYQAVWWQLFHSPNSSAWSLLQLSFSLYQYRMVSLRESF